MSIAIDKLNNNGNTMSKFVMKGMSYGEFKNFFGCSNGTNIICL